MVITSKFPVVVQFLDRNYRYKLVATQIPADTRLTPITHTSQKSSFTEDQTSAESLSTSSKQYALNRVTTCNNYNN